MPRTPSPASRTSLYRLINLEHLSEGVHDKYLEHPGFTASETQVAGRESWLISGTMTTERVGWASAVELLTNQTIELGNMTAAAVLVIRRDEHGAWALTYGMGFHLLDETRIDVGFGQRIAIRTADPTALSSLTRTTLDQRARTDRLSIPSGDDLRGFGVGGFGELVTRLVATAQIPSLAGGATAMNIRGADSLSVPLGRTPDSLVRDLEVLEGVLGQAAPPDLEVLEQLVAVKDQPELIEELNGAFSEALGDADHARLGLSWPHERIDENGTPRSFRVHGVRHKDAQDGTPTVESVLGPVAALAPAQRLDRLHRMRIQLFSDADGQDLISSLIPAQKWLAFEIDLGTSRYCLHDGRWYCMGQDYAQKLRAQVQAIFTRTPGAALPQWPPMTNERDYNVIVGQTLGGIVLDRELIRTDLHSRGIEPCDVITADGVLIHIKNIESSSPASHLLAQALVSTDALLFDEQARAELRDRVAQKGGDPACVPDRPEHVVLGIARRGRVITADDLFSFTQVTLVRNVMALDSQRVDVSVVPIVRPE